LKLCTQARAAADLARGNAFMSTFTVVCLLYSPQQYPFFFYDFTWFTIPPPFVTHCNTQTKGCGCGRLQLGPRVLEPPWASLAVRSPLARPGQARRPCGCPPAPARCVVCRRRHIQRSRDACGRGAYGEWGCGRPGVARGGVRPRADDVGAPARRPPRRRGRSAPPGRGAQKEAVKWKHQCGRIRT